MTPALLNEHKVFPRAGSFWSSVVSPETRQQARALLETTERNQVMSGIDRAAVRLTDNSRVIGKYLDLHVNVLDVVSRRAEQAVVAQWSTYALPVDTTVLEIPFSSTFLVTPGIVLVSLLSPVSETSVIAVNVVSYSTSTFTVALTAPVTVEGYRIIWYATSAPTGTASVTDQSGQQTIPAGVSLVWVPLPQLMSSAPVVTGSVHSPESGGTVSVVSHSISGTTVYGFYVALSSPLEVTATFNWRATAPLESQQQLVPAGSASVTVFFDIPLQSPPTILGSFLSVGDPIEVITAVISEVTIFGFTATFSSPPLTASYFNWEAYQTNPTVPPPYDTWEFPVPDITPLAFQTKAGKRILGADYEFNNGVVVFRESVYPVFDFPRVQVFAYQENTFNLQNYALSLEVATDNVQEVARYYRSNQTAVQFQKAIAVAAGYVVLQFTGTLQARIGDLYVFDTGVVRVPYVHDLLTVGTLYPEGTVVGGMVTVTASTGGVWWRNLDWSQGLSLDSLIPFQGLSVPDSNQLVSTTTQSTVRSGKYHVSAPLVGSATVQEKFWAHQAAAEDRCNVFISTALGLTAGTSININLVDLFFQYLGHKALIIDLKLEADSTDYHARALRFIAREKPVGSLPIIRYT